MKALLFMTTAAVVIATPAFTDEKKKLYNAASYAIWHDHGTHVAVGYGESFNNEKALEKAQKDCLSKGAPFCYLHGPWDKGCVFLVIGNGPKMNGYVMKKTKEAAIQACGSDSDYSKCSLPIGGCVTDEEDK